MDDFEKELDDAPVTIEKVKFRKVFSGAVLFVVLVLTPLALFGYRELYTKVIEADPPAITVTEQTEMGVGTKPMPLEFTVSDPESGLDEIIVRTEQAGDTRDIFKKHYSERTYQDKISVPIAGKEAHLRAGSARVMILAFDKSIWSNRRLVTIDIRVDYEAPVVQVLTTQHNVTLGGVEFVFYRLPGEDPRTFSAVRVGELLFPGFPAKNLDPDFESQSDLFFAFFAVPLGFSSERDQIRVFARDLVGNTTTAPVPYRLAALSRAKRNEELSDYYMQTKVDPLYRKYLELEKTTKPGSDQPAASPSEAIERFQTVNLKYRESVTDFFEKFFTRPIAEQLWDGSFTWLAGTTKGFFGEERQFVYQGYDAGMTTLDGVELASIPRSSVKASNNGIVIFADDLGPYGNTVIIDHGFGLSSCYSYLSSISRREGDRVKKGEEIGVTGDTGLATSDRLHYQIRLFGIPVRPQEWWDKTWINGHITNKKAAVKKLLGLKALTPLDE